MRIAAPDTSGRRCRTQAAFTACRVAKLSQQSSTTSAVATRRSSRGRIGPLRDRLDLHLRVQRGHCFGGRRGLGLAQPLHGVGDLALQVGQLHLVVVHQRQAADAGTAQVQGDRRAQSARADHQRVRGQQPLLAFDADVIEQDVARVAQELVVVHAAILTLPWHGSRREKKKAPHRGALRGCPCRGISSPSSPAGARSGFLLASTGEPLSWLMAWPSWKSLSETVFGWAAFVAAGRVLGQLFFEPLARFFACLVARRVLLFRTLAAVQVLLQVGLTRAQRGERAAFGGFRRP